MRNAPHLPAVLREKSGLAVNQPHGRREQLTYEATPPQLCLQGIGSRRPLPRRREAEEGGFDVPLPEAHRLSQAGFLQGVQGLETFVLAGPYLFQGCRKL